MILIAHRGNLLGKSEKENHPDFIDQALLNGFDVEIDLWFKNQNFFLGHDYCQYLVSLDWLNKRANNIWIHCKNKECLSILINTDLHYFWHQNDNFTLTSRKYIWAYPGQEIISKRCIQVISGKINQNSFEIDNYGGICSDYVAQIRDFL